MDVRTLSGRPPRDWLPEDLGIRKQAAHRFIASAKLPALS